MIERYIAIDNVCGWPNLKQLRDGTLVVTIFNQPNHGRTEGDVECWASEDGGRLWRLRSVPARHEPGTNRMNVSVGFNKQDELVVLASGHVDRPRSGEPPKEATGMPMESWSCVSGDGAHTWEVTRSFPPACEPDMSMLVPYGDIHIAGDGSLGASCYAVRLGGQKPKYMSSYFLKSRDGGRTWGDVTLLGQGDFNETATFHLGQVRWLAAARTSQSQSLVLFSSEDDGQSWQQGQYLGLGLQHPASFMRLQDGRLMLSMGNRSLGHEGVDIRLSSDEGRTWNAGIQILRLPRGDLGYPSTVQLEDGTLVTAWYASRVEAHMRYHVGVMRWRVEDFFPPPRAV